jgi:hypothetical protein
MRSFALLSLSLSHAAIRGERGRKICNTIFELGMKRFQQEPDFLLAYVDFLAASGDVMNIRALFNAIPAGPRVAAQLGVFSDSV